MKRNLKEVETAVLNEITNGYLTNPARIARFAGVSYKTAIKYRDKLVNNGRVRATRFYGNETAYADNATVKYDVAGVNQKLVSVKDEVFHFDFEIEQEVPIINFSQLGNDEWLKQRVTLSLRRDLLEQMLQALNGDGEVPFF